MRGVHGRGRGKRGAGKWCNCSCAAESRSGICAAAHRTLIGGRAGIEDTAPGLGEPGPATQQAEETALALLEQPMVVALNNHMEVLRDDEGQLRLW